MTINFERLLNTHPVCKSTCKPVAYFGKASKFQLIMWPCLNYQAMGRNTGYESIIIISPPLILILSQINWWSSCLRDLSGLTHMRIVCVGTALTVHGDSPRKIARSTCPYALG